MRLALSHHLIKARITHPQHQHIQVPALQIQTLLSAGAPEVMRSERAGSQVDVGDGLGKVPIGANRQQGTIGLNFRYNLFVMLKSPNAISTLSVSWSIINNSLR